LPSEESPTSTLARNVPQVARPPAVAIVADLLVVPAVADTATVDLVETEF